MAAGPTKLPLSLSTVERQEWVGYRLFDIPVACGRERVQYSRRIYPTIVNKSEAREK